MAENFDPYHRWLGIGPEHQPPDNYRLLGIALFESDRDVIDSVALRHISFLQDITDGPYVAQAQRLLNELAAARRCLLDSGRKAAYDASLKERLAREVPPPPVAADARQPAETGTANSGGIQRKPQAETPSVAAPAFPVLGTASPIARQVRPGRGGKSHRPLGDLLLRLVKRGGAVPGPRWRGMLAAAVAAAMLLLIAALWSGRDREPASGDPPTGDAEVAVMHAAVEPKPEDDAAIPWPPLRKELAAETGDEALARRPAGLPDAAPQAVSSDMQSDAPVAEPVEPLSGPAPLPRQIEGLTLWLDAADRATLQTDPAGRIVRWQDRSEHGFVAEADGEDQRPSLSSEGPLPAVQFSGAQSLGLARTSTPLNLGSQFTWLFVARGESGVLMSKGSGDSKGSFVLTGGGARLQIGGADFSARGDRGDAARVRAVVADAESLRWFVDGDPNHSHTGSGHGIGTPGVLRVGCVWKRSEGAQEHLRGQLAELLIYDRALGEDQRSQLEQYLADKWLDGPQAPPPLSIETADTSTLSETIDTGDPWGTHEQWAEESQAEEIEPAVENAGEVADEFVEEEQTETDGEPPARFTLFVNLGGGGYTDADGNLWQPSKRFDGRDFGHEGGRLASGGAPLFPQQLWTETAIRDLTAFRAIVPDGTYEVTFCFCEHWTTDPTRRRFYAVLQRGTRSQITIPFHGPGMGRPWTRIERNVTVRDGTLDIEFSPLDSDSLPILNAIIIRQRTVRRR